MAPTPSSKIIQSLFTPSKTPHSKHRLNFGGSKSVHPSPNPNTAQKEITPAEHPVEVIGRIRDYPDRKDKPSSSLLISTDGQTIRVRSDIVYRDFSLDGVSLSENEDLEEFYKKFVEERINGVKLGSKCTIMMYGPTGSGKSHTMFGCSKQPGIVYRALKDILGEGEDNGNCHENPSSVSFVHVTVLEIYNEEIYDLLSNNNGGGISFGWPKGNTPKVRLEVMGKRAKNATFISGTDAGKLSKEVAKVEKRRIVKSTLCNERSSRSHCLIILDVPSVGGRLMLVDMAGSENIEQAGQTGVEAKMQTAKINHGNIALKRVVESIANGDSHVPFRDSKLTMLLQDSFEDDKSKILMILCASPDPKELHKTISTLEYGAKAKCIVRNTNITTQKDKIGTEDTSCVILGSRIEAMDQFIYKLQMENKIKEKECDKIQKELLKKQEEVVQLKSKLEQIEERALVDKEEEINIKVNERTSALKLELEKKLQGCQKMADELVEKGRRRMEERILQHQQEVEMFRQRLEEIEFELRRSQNDNSDPLQSIEGSKIFQKFTEIYGDNGEQGMEKSMDLDMDDLPIVRDVREINVNSDQAKSHRNNSPLNSHFSHVIQESDDSIPCRFTETRLSTVFEEEEEGEAENVCEKEVDKEILEETTVPYTQKLSPLIEPQDDAALARLTRIQNIFMLCGNNRELAQQHTQAEFPVKTKTSDSDIHQVTPTKLCGNIINDQLFADVSDGKVSYSQKNMSSRDEERDELIEVYVKWETSKENNQGQLITKLKIPKNSSLTELRNVIKTQIGEENNQQEFSFLMLGDPTGAPVSEEKEETIQVRKLPVIPNQTSVHLACLRQNKKTTQQRSSYLFPFNPLENKLPLSPTECFSPKCKQILSSNAQRITTIPPLI